MGVTSVDKFESTAVSSPVRGNGRGVEIETGNNSHLEVDTSRGGKRFADPR